MQNRFKSRGEMQQLAIDLARRAAPEGGGDRSHCNYIYVVLLSRVEPGRCQSMDIVCARITLAVDTGVEV